jgi:hypothetical protein
MGRLEENLALCFQAVRHAKQGASRSANQHYYYSKSPFADRVRHEFLLSCTRGSNYGVSSVDQDGNIDGLVKDPDVVLRRKMVQQLMQSSLSRSQKMKQLDIFIKQWGKDYFWERCIGYSTVMNVGFNGDQGDREWVRSKIVKYGGISRSDFGQMSDEQFQVVMQRTNMKQAARYAAKFGVGNCDEKASLAAEFLVDWSLPGRKLACCYCDPAHKGLTGGIVSKLQGDEQAGGGDHVFCVYDLEEVSESVREWGKNAVIVDGWMNDAYPARHHLLWKYGFNYKGQRINLKQLTIRNMICISYQNHIKTRYCWTLEEGPARKDALAKNKLKVGDNPGYESLWRDNPTFG